ncbi:hypothetical protein K504DRAFT_388446, partial [Pleomassaria siparia CBS 279.74]
MIETFEETFVVLDALDECADLDGLFNHITTVTSWGLQAFHCLLTSRIETTLHNTVLPAFHVQLEAKVVNDDIRRYIRQVLETDTAFKRWKGKPQAIKIEDELMKNAAGMFQYAACHLETLKTCPTPRKLNEKLSSMPKTLDETYQRMLEAISPHYVAFARTMLCWLAYARRPLLITEVVDAMAFVQTEDEDVQEVEFDIDSRLADSSDIITICPSLVTFLDDIETNTKQVRLAHNSISDYIVSNRMPDRLASSFKMDLVASHAEIAKGCLAYLLEFESHGPLTSEAISEFPLARYAAVFWTQHARIADEAGESTGRMALTLLLDRREAFENWIRLFDPDVPEEGPDFDEGGRQVKSPLYYASLLGLTNVI